MRDVLIVVAKGLSEAHRAAIGANEKIGALIDVAVPVLVKGVDHPVAIGTGPGNGRAGKNAFRRDVGDVARARAIGRTEKFITLRTIDRAIAVVVERRHLPMTIGTGLDQVAEGQLAVPVVPQNGFRNHSITRRRARPLDAVAFCLGNQGGVAHHSRRAVAPRKHGRTVER